MNDRSETTQEILEEIAALKQRIREMEPSKSERGRAEDAMRSSDTGIRMKLDAIFPHKIPVPTILLFIVATLVFALISTSATAVQPDKAINTFNEQKVLVLHSYDSAMAWTKSIQEGIESVFNKSGIVVEMHVEYMDTIRHRTKESFGYLEDLYRKKYGRTSFDVILLSDNNALNFMLSRREKLFPGVPIVFCGVNDFRVEQLHGQTGITGINEAIDIRGTIELASRIMPDIRKFLVISDRTAAGLANRRKFEQILSHFSNKTPSFELLDDLTTTDLQKQLGELSSDSAVLLFMFRRDSDGRIFTPPEYFSMVVEGCSVPVFTFWYETSLGTGVMGGVMVSGSAQGERAAEYALRILKGEAASSLPFVMKSPNLPILNYSQIKRFNVSKRVIPEGVVIQNEPITFYYRHRATIWLTSIFILSLVFVNIFLMINIARRRRAEDGLRKSERKYRNIFENATEGIFQSTPEGQYVSVNPAFARIGGYDSPGDIIVSVADIQKKMYVHQEDRARLLELFKKQDVVNNFEAEIRRRDNEIIWISTNVKAIRDQSGKVILLEGTIEDITERKRAEDEIRKLNAELEQRVAARTAELTEKSRQMETFTYSVSHDLKAPLRGIDGYSRLLLEDYSDRLDEEGRTFLTTIRQATEDMRQLIEDLLAYSRMERRSLATHELHPLDLMQTLLAERQEEINTRNVSVTVDMPDIVVKADPEGMAQVLRNLLDNALKFTGKSPDPHIEIGGEEKEKHCIFWVRDNGLGFDMRYHDRIFEIFQRLNPVEDYPGTGIGMAIVQKAMQRMGGRVWAESAPCKGATFYLEVPK